MFVLQVTYHLLEAEKRKLYVLQRELGHLNANITHLKVSFHVFLMFTSVILKISLISAFSIDKKRQDFMLDNNSLWLFGFCCEQILVKIQRVMISVCFKFGLSVCQEKSEVLHNDSKESVKPRVALKIPQ